MNVRQEIPFRAERKTEERVANRGKRRKRETEHESLTDANTSMNDCIVLVRRMRAQRRFSNNGNVAGNTRRTEGRGKFTAIR